MPTVVASKSFGWSCVTNLKIVGSGLEVAEEQKATLAGFRIGGTTITRVVGNMIRVDPELLQTGSRQRLQLNNEVAGGGGNSETVVL